MRCLKLLIQSLIEVFANKSLQLTLIESLPKEKTAILGTAEISLYSHFLNYFVKESNDMQVPPCPLVVRQTLSVSYANQKLLVNPEKGPPEITIEISLSKPLLDQTVLQGGVFATFSVVDMLPLPEDWVKESVDTSHLI